MAQRLPAWVNSDHLTTLAGLATAGGGHLLLARPGARPWAMFVGSRDARALNWFGDSLDGTLARVRHHERPRYGFYVDHVLDAVGILLLLGGFALGGFMSPLIAAGFLIAYYLLTIEIALATHAVGTFRISFWKFGPTELRILLAVGTLQLLHSPFVTIAGRTPAALRCRRRGRHCRASRDVRRVGGQKRQVLSTRWSRCLDGGRDAPSGVESRMILAAVDDLLFSSKIRTTAKLAGVELVFARTPIEILSQARALKPELIIFDLNSAKADPINTVVALRGDPDLKSVPTMGFVSHVDTQLIRRGARGRAWTR